MAKREKNFIIPRAFSGITSGAHLSMRTKEYSAANRITQKRITITPPSGAIDYRILGRSFIRASSSHDESKRGGPPLDSKLALKKIMIVDDEAQIAKLYSLILSNLGFTVSDLEFDGSAAVERISRDKDIDLIVIDQRMPKLDGTSATRKIKSMKPEVKVIMVTAYEIQEQDRALFDEILTKPISSKALAEAVTKVLSRA
jgi:CheY-like chemotaxis protein